MLHRNLIFILLSTLIFCYCSPKNLQVHNEPMHRPVFKSKKARILDIRFPPRDTCFYHEHSKNYYYVALKGGKCFVQNKGEAGRVLNLPDGYSGGKFDMPNEKFMHRIANLDTDTIKYIAVENLRPRKSKMKDFKPSIIEKLSEDNDKFRVIKLQIPPGVIYSYEFEQPLLLVNAKEFEFEINESVFKKSWFWYEKGNRLSIKNTNSEVLELVSIFLK